MPSAEVEALVSQLTLEEKCAMVVGKTPWVIAGCARLGIPEWCVSDGPVGARGRAQGPGLVVPGPSALSATWDVELIERVGEALGVECGDRNVDLLLAPTVNLHRSPRGGRHFESYSEDPHLSSRMAVAYIGGVQSTGIGACVKHFVANDQEFERFTIDVEVDERTLREIYLPPFEAAVKDGGVRSVMGAYNYINGRHGCAHEEYLVRILKGEWAFDGFVVSDWGAIKETTAPARFGLDLEMPGPGRFWGRGKLRAAIEAGDVDESTLDDKVARILSFLEWRGRLRGETDHREASVERPEHRALAREAAAAAAVLIRNEAGILPLATDRTVALIGPGAEATALLGGGSASLRAHRTTNVADALRERLADRLVGTALGVDMRRKPDRPEPRWIEGPITVELWDGTGFDGRLIAEEASARTLNVWMSEAFPAGVETLSLRMRFTLVPPTSGTYRVCPIAFGPATLYLDGEWIVDNETNGFGAGPGMHGATTEITLDAGRPYEIIVEAPPRADQNWLALVDVGIEPVTVTREELIVEAVSLAGRADTAVLVVGSSSEWESEGGDRESISLPNGQDELVERVVATNPNTVVVLNCGAPMTLPWLDDVAAAVLAWYPGQEAGEAIADVLIGDADPGGRMPTTWARQERDTPAFLNYPGEAGVVRYGEGVFVGYRWYDARGVEPMIPFGHGGSYTTFEWGAPTVSGSGTDLVVEVPVTNTGDRAGSEVVQVYVAPDEHVVPRPDKELAGFAKLHLDPGGSATARVELRERSFARWDPGAHEWTVDPGDYSLVVAASAVDERGRIDVTV